MAKNKYVSDKTKVVHAWHAHTGAKRVEDIRVEPWAVLNVSSYTYCAVPKPEYREIAALAVSLAMDIANDRCYGYKTGTKRWEIWQQVERYRSKYQKIYGEPCSTPEAIAGCDGNWYGCDCSALVLMCYKWAGLPFKTTWKCCTESLYTCLRKSGCFDIYSDREHCATDEYAQVGALYWKPKAHVVMSINDYDPFIDVEDEPEEELTKSEVPSVKVLEGKTMVIRSKPTSLSSKVGYAKEGLYPVEEVTSNNWAKVEQGYISLNTSNTELVNCEK